MKNKPNIRYIVELVITLLLILFIAVVLVRVFVLSRGRSMYANNLTEAVKLAESIAEISYGTDGQPQFTDTLRGMDNVISVEQTDAQIILQLYGGNDRTDDDIYRVVIDRSPQETDCGALLYDEISVYPQGADEAIWRLQIGNYVSGKEAQ